MEYLSNKYIFTLLVSKRIVQLQKGAKPLVSADLSEPLYAIAVRELIAGKIKPQNSDTKIPAIVPNLEIATT